MWDHHVAGLPECRPLVSCEAVLAEPRGGPDLSFRGSEARTWLYGEGGFWRELTNLAVTEEQEDVSLSTRHSSVLAVSAQLGTCSLVRVSKSMPSPHAVPCWPKARQPDGVAGLLRAVAQVAGPIGPAEPRAAGAATRLSRLARVRGEGRCRQLVGLLTTVVAVASLGRPCAVRGRPPSGPGPSVLASAHLFPRR